MQKHFRFKHNPVFLSLCCAFLVPLAQADTLLKPVEVQAQRSEATLGLELPTTSGSRTGVSSMELPASLAIVDSDTMKERGDAMISDAVVRTVGLTNIGTGGNGGQSYSARGFTGVGSVGIAEDGIRFQTAAGTQNYPFGSWGYERIEVLRGPASVVYGSGTVGATINAVRKEPSRIASHEVMLGAGTEGYKQIGFGSTGALGEIASYRVDVHGFDNDGVRQLGDADGGKLMSKLRLQPNSDLRIDFTADYSKAHPENYWGTPSSNGKVIKSLREKNYNTSDATIRYEDLRLKARAEWRANDWLTLSNEMYRFKSDRLWLSADAYAWNANGTISRGGYGHFEHNMVQKGNRLEALIQTGSHRAVAGWEYSRFDLDYTSDWKKGPFDTLSATHPLHGSYYTYGIKAPVQWSTKSRFNAFYLEDAWKFHDRWQLMAGVRRDEAKLSRTAHVPAQQKNAFSGKEINGTAWRLGLTHFLSKETSLYANASKGHDPVAHLVSISPANTDFKLTKARQYEAGIKQHFGNGLGEWTAAVFHIKKDDILTYNQITKLTDQGGSQSSKGIELSAAISPAKNWRFEGNITRLKAEYDEFIDRDKVDRSGNTPINVPKTTANLWGHYRLGDWQASLGARYVGKSYADVANTVVLPAYTVADASLAWRFDKKTTFRLLGRNLTDKVYANNTYNGNQFVLGEPRRFDLVAEMKF